MIEPEIRWSVAQICWAWAGASAVLKQTDVLGNLGPMRNTVSLKSSVTRSRNYFYNIWPFIIMKICQLATKNPNVALKFGQILNKPSKNYQRLQKFGQSGEILPSLVTLESKVTARQIVAKFGCWHCMALRFVYTCSVKRISLGCFICIQLENVLFHCVFAWEILRTEQGLYE